MSDYTAKFRITADVVLFCELDDETQPVKVLLIKRRPESHAFPGYWALPGGHAEAEERLWQAAERELKEETGLSCSFLTQLGLYDAPDRDPRGRVITVAYYGSVYAETAENLVDFGRQGVLKAGDDAVDAKWVDITKLNLSELAFDHAQIILDAYAKWK